MIIRTGSEDGEESSTNLAILIGGGASGFVLVYVVLSCVCWLRKSSTTAIESGDGYQEFRDTTRIGRPSMFKKARKTLSNGNVANNSANNRGAQQIVGVVPHHHHSSSVGGSQASTSSKLFFHKLRAAPLPVVPTSCSTPSTSVVGRGADGGNLTRESSTSELYASVDRNPSGNNEKEMENRRRRQRRRGSSESRGNEADDVGNEEEDNADGEEHTYSKIRPPPGTYDEIDDIADGGGAKGKVSVDSLDPFYSRVSNEFRAATKTALQSTIPPPVPRFPLKRASHPYDYPKFQSQNERDVDRWQELDSAGPSVSRKKMTFVGDGDATGGGANGDALYSKIESQYGGSEDPYSSIKGSEEHYSCVFPNGLAENGNDKASTSSKPSGLPGRTGTIPAYGSIRPRAIRAHVQPRRSRSDGEEYSVIRKPMNQQQQHKVGQNDSRDYERHHQQQQQSRAPPPIPEKLFTHDSWQRAPRGHYESVDEPSTSSAAAAARRNDEIGRPSYAQGGYDREAQQADGGGDQSTRGAKREPSYRFITVRESLDALRARMEAAAVATTSSPTNPPLGGTTPSAPTASQSDTSLHYYATISEHSYEVVPSRRGSERHAQRQEPNIRTVSYIDDDEYELETEDTDDALLSRTPAANDSLNSTMVDEANTSSNTLMNVSIHSHTGSHANSTGSHVTLVHVGGGTAAPTQLSNPPIHDTEIVDSTAVHLRRNQNRLLDSDRRKARLCRLGSTDDEPGPSQSTTASASAASALSIDIEAGLTADENLATVDGRDFNPSIGSGRATNGTDFRSGYSLDVLLNDEIDGGDGNQQHRIRSSTHERRQNETISRSVSARSPEIVALETLENFNVSSSNSLNEDDIQARATSKNSDFVSYQL